MKLDEEGEDGRSWRHDGCSELLAGRNPVR